MSAVRILGAYVLRVREGCVVLDAHFGCCQSLFVPLPLVPALPQLLSVAAVLLCVA